MEEDELASILDALFYIRSDTQEILRLLRGSDAHSQHVMDKLER